MQIINDDISLLGEGPIWNYFDDSFYWVDIIEHQIKSWNDNEFQIFHLGNNAPTSVGLIDGTKLFVTVSNGVGIYDKRDLKYHPLAELNMGNCRLNDGKADKNGNYWVGSMDNRDTKEQIGSLYTYDKGLLVKKVPTVALNISKY